MTSIAEKAELSARVSELIARLLCHHKLPGARTLNSAYLIDALRRSIDARIRRTPPLARVLWDKRWLDIIWRDAVVLAAEQTYTVDFPAQCPWSREEIREIGWLPPDAE